ncbi:MAG TPA: AraC family transcriptional regulator ligand-binding domain-containing protein [Polyangiales bacterium]|nr:AraC family transcriptional regulator ligand-binding domain-containing protein [Polyangiales bacterium]
MVTEAEPVAAANATVSITAITPFLRLLEESGNDVVMRAVDAGEAAFARWSIEPESFLNPTLRLPHDLVIDLLISFTEILDDTSAPLRAGTKLNLGDYELLEYLCCTCRTLGETIACLGKYYPLLIAAEYEAVIEGDRAEVRFRIAPGLRAPDSINEFAVASNLTMAALHLQAEGIQLPIEIHFSHAAPAHAATVQQLFGTPVLFGRESNAIVFPVSMLSHPMRTADPVLHDVLRRLADQELGALNDLSAFPARVRAAMQAELRNGARLDTVAARLHLSPSAVRSRLLQHGTTHTELLDRLRRDTAERLLRQSQLSFAEIAHALGFSHPPAFHRAVRRWFGLTPSAYREAPSTHPAAKFFRRDR